MLRTLLTLTLLSCNPPGPITFETVRPIAPPESPDSPESPGERVFDHSHAVWSEILGEHVSARGFDYASLAKDPTRLGQYLGLLRTVTPAQLAGWTEDERFAFWINVYNANAVALVVEHYPVDSIRDIGTLLNRVWDKEFIELPGMRPDGEPGKLSLNHVEHEILRKRFDDARVHAAVNCASESCPPLRAEAFTAAALDEQLDEQTRAWLSNAALNRFDRAGNRVAVSEIFNWFRVDFEREAGSVQAWLARYAPAEQAAWLTSATDLRVDHLDYSWSLNDASKKPD